MGTKLTLSMEPSVISRAKRFARNRNRSLSRLIEEYLVYITREELEFPGITDTVSRLADTISVPVPDDDLKYAYLHEKYLDE